MWAKLRQLRPFVALHLCQIRPRHAGLYPLSMSRDLSAFQPRITLRFAHSRTASLSIFLSSLLPPLSPPSTLVTREVINFNFMNEFLDRFNCSLIVEFSCICSWWLDQWIPRCVKTSAMNCSPSSRCPAFNISIELCQYDRQSLDKWNFSGRKISELFLE